MVHSLASNYVPENVVPADRLASIDFPELPHHDCMWGMALADDGTVYLAVCGELLGGLSTHLYSYDPQEHVVRELADYAEVCGQPSDDGHAPQSKIHYSICPGPDGRIYTATHCTGAPWGWRAWTAWKWWGHAEHNFPGSHMVVYDPAGGGCEDYGIILPEEGCRAMKLDRQRMLFHIITYPRSHYCLFDLERRELKDLGRVSCVNPQRIFLDKKGNGYTTDDFGTIVRCNVEAMRLENLPVRLPGPHFCTGGLNPVYEAVEGPGGSEIYGLTWSGQSHLFRYDPERGEYGRMEDLGPTFFQDINRFDSYGSLNLAGGLTVGADGWLYMCPHDHNVSPGGRRIVRYHPQRGVWEDLGLISNGRRAPFISEGARGLDGTIYFAEDVAAPARLYVYRPPSLPAFADWDEPKRVLRLKDSERRFPSPELQVASTDIDTSGLAISGETTVALRLINEGTLGKGEIELRPLNRYARSGEIAPDAMSIAGVCTSRDAKLFAVTQGIKSHFVSYDHNPRHQHVMNIGVLYEGPVEAGGAVCLSDDTLITWVTPKDGSATALWHYDHQHDCMVFRMKFANVLEPFDVQIGRVAAMAASGKTVAALLEDGAVLILDEKLNTLEKFTGGGIASQKPLLICGRGDRYLCCINGTEVLEISNKTKTPEILIDSKSSPITALASGGEIVAYGTEAGEIKVIKGGGELRSGKAGWRKPVRCLCLTEDGTAWAVAGAGVGHLFRFAAADSEPVSYQTPAANFPYWWVGYEVDHIAPGPGGCLYLAETGRLAHLLIFYPDKG